MHRANRIQPVLHYPRKYTAVLQKSVLLATAGPPWCLTWAERISLLGLMQVLIHWFAMHANLLAILVTVGVAFLLVCCLECTKCPCREKDDLFKRHEV